MKMSDTAVIMIVIIIAAPWLVGLWTILRWAATALAY